LKLPELNEKAPTDSWGEWENSKIRQATNPNPRPSAVKMTPPYTEKDANPELC